MGAAQFITIQAGSSPAAAFASAVEKAQYDHGHSGYSGTIAEKSDFKLFEVSEDFLIEMREAGSQYSHRFWNQVDDKWGPAGCFDLKDGTFMFFGWASE